MRQVENLKPKVGHPVTKLPTDHTRFRRNMRITKSARQAFSHLLSLMAGDGVVLMPAFIGWSAREGSGVFDPVAELNLKFNFYKLDERLRIDLKDLEERLNEGNVRVLLLIHYFGYVDPQAAEAAAAAKVRGICVIEDSAHALFSDWVGGSCGQFGQASIYSFHKLLPVDGGGGVSFQGNHQPCGMMDDTMPAAYHWFDFDLRAIAYKRLENARQIDQRIGRLNPVLEPLWGLPAAGQFPQTYPVLLQGKCRDSLYDAMNASGFGVVSLYHTMIRQIKHEQFPTARHIASQILNLPVHQDLEPDQIDSMLDHLERLVC